MREMKDIKDILGSMTVTELVAPLKKRRLPLVKEEENIEEVIDAMVTFGHSRLLYVVDENRKLTGAISLGLLTRHVFSPSHEPQIHARFLMDMITAETAKDIMQKNPVIASIEDNVVAVLERMIKANVKEIPILDEERRIVADLTIIDLLKVIINSRLSGS